MFTCLGGSAQNVFRRLWGGRSGTTVVVECRDCGWTIDEDDIEECPACGSTEIARYAIE
jgi:predicted Zn-ribbon and HTH transcriptional regulator